jgi:signal peptidase I
MFKNAALHLWKEWIRPLGLPLLLITAAKSALADFNPVPTGSMIPTVLVGDVVIVNKLAYDLKVPFTTTHLAQWGDPAHGDIVVCFEPDNGTRLLKRVVGLPGDTIELHNETLYLNGTPLRYSPMSRADERLRDVSPAERTAALFARESLGDQEHSVMILPRLPAQRSFPPLTLAPGSYFMMGDNRDNSKDSRSFGVVSRDQIVGKAVAVLASGNLDHFCRPRLSRFFSRLD